MKRRIGDTLNAILRNADKVLLATPETDFAAGFLHTLINYARAKRESEGVLARIREMISIETRKPVGGAEIKGRFLNLVQERFGIQGQPAEELFEALQEDAE